LGPIFRYYFSWHYPPLLILCKTKPLVMSSYEYRKIQALIGETSFSVVLPKSYAIDLGMAKGDFVRVRQEENKIIIEKA
jgi:hypothetical protein